MRAGNGVHALKVGMDAVLSSVVDGTRLVADHSGEGILATPGMILLMELAARRAVEPHLGDTEVTVGFHVDVRHLAPVPRGATVETSARVVDVDGRKIAFAVACHHGDTLVGTGTHKRAVVGRYGTGARDVALKTDTLSSSDDADVDRVLESEVLAEVSRPGGLASLTGASLFFEDMTIGRQFTSGGRTITDAEVAGFAGVSGDFNPLHVNEVFAASGPFGQRIAHGLLVLAVASGLRQQMGIFHGSLRALLEIRSWKFLAPVLIGDTVFVHTTVESRRETSSSEQGIVTQGVDVTNQHGDVVQAGELVLLMMRREGQSPEPGGRDAR